jgi:alkylhydroperoxidase/carboxymuconolactone decarboxylase family protein YurZ
MDTSPSQMKQDRAYGYFRHNSGEVGKAFHEMYEKTVSNSVLDKKTHEFVYIAYLAATKEYSGLELHVKGLKKNGASRAEVESVMLCGLAPLGISLSYAYQVAMSAYDSE